MKILVDCDAMPRPLKEVLLKVAEREKIETRFIAARSPRLPESTYVKTIGAGNAFDGADDLIIETLVPGDLVITADIKLADRAIAKAAEVLTPKGEFLLPVNIKHALAMRDLLDELRVAGEVGGGPAPFSERQRVDFINALNRYCGKQPRKTPDTR